MNLKRAKQLQDKMPYKKIFWDTVYKCYRLIKPSQFFEYQDEEGKWNKRINPETLIVFDA